jgi:hypothetical protein
LAKERARLPALSPRSPWTTGARLGGSIARYRIEATAIANRSSALVISRAIGETLATRLAVSILLVGDVRREVKAPRPAAS